MKLERIFSLNWGISIFNGIRDAGPDKWGRYLLDKKFSKGLSEIEYIISLGPDRVGALAFGPDAVNGPKKYNPDGFEAYTGKRLTLETCLSGVDDALKNNDTAILWEYLNYGPSLGGARPKATVTWKGKSYLAKFSLSGDEKNEPLTEFATMKLAQKCGLRVTDLDYTEILSRGIFLIERFDRDESANPIPFISALTATGLAENDHHSWSYFHICDSVKKYSHQMMEDLTELFTRLIFNICVYNNDDHMRNFGFVYVGKNKWRLSPLYDVVPSVIHTSTYALAMSFGDEGKKASIKNALSRAGEFGLEQSRAQKITAGVVEIVKDWRTEFTKLGLSKNEIKKLENSFKYKD